MLINKEELLRRLQGIDDPALMRELVEKAPEVPAVAKEALADFIREKAKTYQEMFFKGAQNQPKIDVWKCQECGLPTVSLSKVCYQCETAHNTTEEK